MHLLRLKKQVLSDQYDFEDIEVKINASQLPEDNLRRKRKKCMIGTGAMTDLYIHLEEKTDNTRKHLELISTYGFGLAIQTKSARILEIWTCLRR